MTDDQQLWQVPDPPQIEYNPLPGWSLVFRDMIGIGFAVLSGMFGALSVGSNMIAQEFFASARLKRARKEQRRQERQFRRQSAAMERDRAKMAKYLDSMVEGDARTPGGES